MDRYKRKIARRTEERFGNDYELHLAYLKDGKWKIWIDDELVLNGDAWIDNTLDQKGFGVIAWVELPKRADWQEIVI